MKWLLNDWSQLEADVVQRWNPPKRLHTGVVPRRLVRRVTFAAGTLLAVSIYMPGLHVNSPSIAVSVSGTHGISSAHETRPPLDGTFGNRFDGSWTPALEDSLLMRFAEKKSLDPKNHLKQVVETIYFNQIEDPESDAPRLDRDEIVRIVGQKKRT